MGRLENTRRDLLRFTGSAFALGLAGCIDVPRVDTPGTDSAEDTFASRATFDELDERYHEDGGLLGETNDSDGSEESGLLAWNESLVLQAYLYMYRAAEDVEYLDAFVDHANSVLAARDSERGVTDYRGESLPAWRADSPFTIGRVALTDDHDRRTLEVRSAVSYADRATATVREGSTQGTFELVVHNWSHGRTTFYDDLTMDQESQNYVVERVNREGFKDETPGKCLVTVADLRESPQDAGDPATGTFHLNSPHHIYAVHTGMITLPLVTFARIVDETPALRSDSRYSGRAEGYRRAAERAVRVHDDQWRETDDGEGYYVFRPGSPTKNESVELPHNQSLALGRTLIQLAVLTGESTYAEKACKLARTFRNDLREDDAGAYVWSYHWSDGEIAAGWSPDDPESEYQPWAPELDDPVADYPEDVSHGHVDVDFAAMAFRDREALSCGRPPFDGDDVERLARTYTENVAVDGGDPPEARRHVDGTGPSGGDFERIVPAWNVLAPWNRGVFEHSNAVYDAKGDEFAIKPDLLLGTAMLNYHDS